MTRLGENEEVDFACTTADTWLAIRDHFSLLADL